MISGKSPKPSIPDPRTPASRRGSTSGTGATRSGRSVSPARDGAPRSSSAAAAGHQAAPPETATPVRDRKSELPSPPRDIVHLGSPQAARAAPGADFDRALADIIQGARDGKSGRALMKAFDAAIKPRLEHGTGRRMSQDALDHVLRRLVAARSALDGAGAGELFQSLVDRLLGEHLGAGAMLGPDRDQVLAFATRSPQCKPPALRIALIRRLFERLGGDRMPLPQVEHYFRGLMQLAHVDAAACAQEVASVMRRTPDGSAWKGAALKGIDAGMVELSDAQARDFDRQLDIATRPPAPAGSAGRSAWE